MSPGSFLRRALLAGTPAGRLRVSSTAGAAGMNKAPGTSRDRAQCWSTTSRECATHARPHGTRVPVTSPARARDKGAARAVTNAWRLLATLIAV
jgi:hypothetical protein